MKRLFLLLTLFVVLGVSCSGDGDKVVNKPKPNEIWYTTTDGKKLFPNNTEPAAFGTLLASNIYKDGQGVLTFDDDITLIGGGAFSDCTTLATITIPESVTEIGEYAFRFCSSLTSVTIPDSVTTIGDSAFAVCSSLTSVTIPDSVTTIGDYAFFGCRSLTSVTIPDSVTTIGDYAFAHCSSLTSVTIPDSVTTIGVGVFAGCSSLRCITIPDSVTTIGNYAFSGCSSLTSVTIPDSVTEIGDYAFENCDNIASVKLPDSVTTVGRGVFAKQPLSRKYADFLHLPHDLMGHFDFDEAVEEAKSVDKPILVYVTGHASNNCREMENMVWSDSKVLPMLQNDFVICALYVDDMTKVEGGKRLGSINSQLAQERWGVNAQPAYILLSPDGKNVLAGPRGYDRDIDAFAEFLKQALASECISQTKCSLKDEILTLFGLEDSAKTVADKTFGKVVNENESDLVEWAVSAEDNGDGTFAVTFEATIADGYHIYPMTDFSAPYFEFDNVEIVGEVVEPLPAEEIIDDFGETELVYYNKATYIFTIKANPGQKISGSICAIICTNDTNQCTANFAEFVIFMPACAY